ncbi:hypothetical protein B0H12DRAFT_1097292 [Mycena haematopus]|nr:hypothetical protein B0H12DRAFT_1142736 [Mycena haematopus]KAJ7268156.1 hypothetical protein B0H12DRAFT_1097292 [Mycena haematopus]
MRWELTAFHFFSARLLFTLTGLNFPPQQPLVFLLQLLLPPAETFVDDVFGEVTIRMRVALGFRA